MYVNSEEWAWSAYGKGYVNNEDYAWSKNDEHKVIGMEVMKGTHGVGMESMTWGHVSNK